jgi:hypothetical protein
MKLIQSLLWPEPPRSQGSKKAESKIIVTGSDFSAMCSGLRRKCAFCLAGQLGRRKSPSGNNHAGRRNARRAARSRQLGQLTHRLRVLESSGGARAHRVASESPL